MVSPVVKELKAGYDAAKESVESQPLKTTEPWLGQFL